MYDLKGNMINWWQNDTMNQFTSKTECFVEEVNGHIDIFIILTIIQIEKENLRKIIITFT